MNTIRTGYPKNNSEALVRFEDLSNLKEEEAQIPFINEKIMSFNDMSYKVINHYPSAYRTYENERGEKVTYPHLLMVHGVASNGNYFDPLCQDMAKLGIASSVVELPRYTKAGFQPKKMLDWQVGAVANTYQSINEATSADSQIILVGHSRGAIIATKAANSLYENDNRPEGLVLLAPAGFDKIAEGKMHKAILLLGPLVLNSLKSGFSNRNRLKQNAAMMLGVVARNIPQSYAEIDQAINIDITNSFRDMPDLDTFVPFAKDDEFIRYEDLYKVGLEYPNVSVVTVDSSHLLDNPKYEDLISLADPRILTGQILAFMMSKIPNYAPKTFHPESGSLARLSAKTNLQKIMAERGINQF